MFLASEAESQANATLMGYVMTAILLNSISSIVAPTSLLSLPPSPQLTVSVAICTAEASSARFFLNNTASDVVELQLDAGNAQWSGSAPEGGSLSVQDFNQGSFQISVSDNGIPDHLYRRVSCQPFRSC